MIKVKLNIKDPEYIAYRRVGSDGCGEVIAIFRTLQDLYSKLRYTGSRSKRSIKRLGKGKTKYVTLYIRLQKDTPGIRCIVKKIE